LGKVYKNRVRQAGDFPRNRALQKKGRVASIGAEELRVYNCGLGKKKGGTKLH